MDSFRGTCLTSIFKEGVYKKKMVAMSGIEPLTSAL